MKTTTLLPDLGGAPALDAAVVALHARLLADPLTAPAFQDVDLRRLRRHMNDFLAVALGAQHDAVVPDVSATHAPLRITDDAFDRVVSTLMDVLHELGVAAATVEAVLDRLSPYRTSIVRPPLR